MRIQIRKGVILELTNNDPLTLEQLEKVKNVLTGNEKVEQETPANKEKVFIKVKDNDLVPLTQTKSPKKKRNRPKRAYKRTMAPRTGEPWTKEENAMIALVPTMTSKIARQLAKELGRSKRAVEQRHYLQHHPEVLKERAKVPRLKTWTPTEDKLLLRRKPKLPQPTRPEAFKPRINPLDEESTQLLMEMIGNVVFHTKQDLTYNQAQHLLRTQEGHYIDTSDWASILYDLLKNKELVRQETGSNQFKIAIVEGIGVIRHN